MWGSGCLGTWWGGDGVARGIWKVELSPACTVPFPKDPPMMLPKLHYCLGVLEHSMPCVCPGVVPTSSGDAARGPEPRPCNALPCLLRRDSLYSECLFCPLPWLTLRLLAFCFTFSVLCYSLVVIIFNAQPKCAPKEIFAHLWLELRALNHSEWRMILIPSISCRGISEGFCMFSFWLVNGSACDSNPTAPNNRLTPKTVPFLWQGRWRWEFVLPGPASSGIFLC